MRTIRSFIDLPLHPERELVLPEMVSNHVVRVLRLETDDIFHLFNGDGYDYPCRILSLEKRGARVLILEKIGEKADRLGANPPAVIELGRRCVEITDDCAGDRFSDDYVTAA